MLAASAYDVVWTVLLLGGVLAAVVVVVVVARASRRTVGAPAVASGRPVAERLAEVDRLYADRTIDAAEHSAARARILGSL